MDATATATASLVPAPPTKIDPLIALELRLRWLEALILGVKQDLGRASLKHGETVSRLAETVQRNLNKAVQGNEGLTKFMDQCMSSFSFSFSFPFPVYPRILLFLDIDDQHSPLLMPSFVLSDTVPDPPTYDKMSAEELDAYLTEMEPEIRTADRDMLEVEALEKRGVTGAGRLLGIEFIYCGLNSS
jgi:P-type Cu+ transporter